MNPSTAELKAALSDFAVWAQTLKGEEKQEAHPFLERLFKAFGHANGLHAAGVELECRLKVSGKPTRFIDVLWSPRLLLEMKSRGQDLVAAYDQMAGYWLDLAGTRPQYCILCDFDVLQVFDLNRQVHDPVDTIVIADIADRWEALTFMLPIPEAPTFGNDLVAVTEEAAAKVAGVFRSMVARGVDRTEAQHFIVQAVLAMFAEDIGLMPGRPLTHVLDDCRQGRGSAYDLVSALFVAMNTPGVTPAGRFKGVPYFNGGIFTPTSQVDLEPSEVESLYEAAIQNWADVRPAIFGTIFEQSMDPVERHRLGAHFTSEVDILKVVRPSIVDPWRERVEAAKSIRELKSLGVELHQYRVLDPACGCGNFLYIAYRELRRIEKRIKERIVELSRSKSKEAKAQQASFAFVAPTQFYGLDIDPFAIEIAKMTMMLGKKVTADDIGDEHSVLPLDDLTAQFQAGDALDMAWPEFDVCIGNPPYLGRRKLQDERGAAYISWLAKRHPDVGGVSDYVVYWFRLAHDQLKAGGRAGLVGTNSIREGDSRKASLDYIVDNGGVITSAVSTQPWSGAANVNVSIVNWVKGASRSKAELWVDGTRVELDVVPTSLQLTTDVRSAAVLGVNRKAKLCFQGQTPGLVAAFVTDNAGLATSWRSAGPKANLVVRPFISGDELNSSGRPNRWIIDFWHASAAEAKAAAPIAFEHVKAVALPKRQKEADDEAEANRRILAHDPTARINKDKAAALDSWWMLWRRRKGLLDATAHLSRMICLSRYAIRDRPSIYAFLDTSIRVADKVIVFAFDDDYSLGVLQSSIHRAWFEAKCTTLGAAISYTSKEIFDTFPWPQSPTAAHVTSVAKAAAAIQAHRLAQEAVGVSLGAMYDGVRLPGRNALRDLHAELDDAVMRAYGFNKKKDLLGQLLLLNTAVAGAASGTARGPGCDGLPGEPRQTTEFITAT